MSHHSRLKTLIVVVVCCLGLGITAGLMGVGLAPQARATVVSLNNDPRIGDYERAQQELDQHLQQRIKLHLARAAKMAQQK